MEEPCPNAAALEGELSWQTVLTDLLVPERNQLGVFGREEEMCDWLLEAATRTRGRSWPPLVQIEYEAKRFVLLHLSGSADSGSERRLFSSLSKCSMGSTLHLPRLISPTPRSSWTTSPLCDSFRQQRINTY